MIRVVCFLIFGARRCCCLTVVIYFVDGLINSCLTSVDNKLVCFNFVIALIFELLLTGIQLTIRLAVASRIVAVVVALLGGLPFELVLQVYCVFVAGPTQHVLAV